MYEDVMNYIFSGTYTIEQVIKLREKYEKRLKGFNENILDYEQSGNAELILASKTLRREASDLNIVVQALGLLEYNMES